MRILSLLLSVPVLVCMAVFAVHNRGPVTLSFWPFDVKFEIPVSLLVLAVFLAGLFLGIVAAAPFLIRTKREKKRLLKEIAKLTKETGDNGSPVCTPSSLSRTKTIDLALFKRK